MGGFGLIAQPLVIAFSVRLRILHNRQTILNADGVAQAPDGSVATPKVAELPLILHIHRRPDDVVMDMRFINMGADHKGMIALGESLSKFHAQPVASSGAISP